MCLTKKYENIIWKVGCAEDLKVEDNTYDFYTISFGLRNTKDLNKSLSEAYRVLKKGGRFLCLEFSKIENSNLEFIYKNYSKIIPFIGQFIVGDKKPYEYLINSIEKFVNQEKLLEPDFFSTVATFFNSKKSTFFSTLFRNVEKFYVFFYTVIKYKGFFWKY